MKKTDTAQLEYQQRLSQIGRPRLCPKCKRQVPTVRRQFVNHGPGPDGSIVCSNSGVSTDPIPNPSNA